MSEMRILFQIRDYWAGCQGWLRELYLIKAACGEREREGKREKPFCARCEAALLLPFPLNASPSPSCRRGSLLPPPLPLSLRRRENLLWGCSGRRHRRLGVPRPWPVCGRLLVGDGGTREGEGRGGEGGERAGAAAAGVPPTAGGCSQPWLFFLARSNSSGGGGSSSSSLSSSPGPSALASPRLSSALAPPY